MISFDVNSLFDNVLLSDTIHFLIWCFYINTKVSINLKKTEMKELILLCTKGYTFHFTYDNLVFKHVAGVATESALGPNLAGIFIVELWKNISSNLKSLP